MIFVNNTLFHLDSGNITHSPASTAALKNRFPEIWQALPEPLRYDERLAYCCMDGVLFAYYKFISKNLLQYNHTLNRWFAKHVYGDAVVWVLLEG